MTPTLLERTESLFRTVRESMIEAAASLYEVHTTNAWQEKYETWQDFIHEIGISQGQASKYLSVVDHYLTHGGLSQRNLSEVELEKLYLARGLDGTPEEQLTKAMVLSRSEIRSQKAYEETGEEHEHAPICRICHVKLS